MTRKDVIWQALSTVYSRDGQMNPGTMVEACAQELDKKWGSLTNFLDEYSSPLDNMTQFIWMWFPGGGTAEIAARRVIKAVDSMDQE